MPRQNQSPHQSPSYPAKDRSERPTRRRDPQGDAERKGFRHLLRTWPLRSYTSGDEPPVTAQVLAVTSPEATLVWGHTEMLWFWRDLAQQNATRPAMSLAVLPLLGRSFWLLVPERRAGGFPSYTQHWTDLCPAEELHLSYRNPSPMGLVSPTWLRSLVASGMSDSRANPAESEARWPKHSKRPTGWSST